jgi:hypothetical protein
MTAARYGCSWHRLNRGATGSGPPLARYTPADMSTMPTQPDVVGHSFRSGMASSADSADTNAGAYGVKCC